MRYIFGLLNRLFSALQLGILTDKVNLELARPVIKKFGKDRVRRHRLSETEEIVLKAIVTKKSIQVSDLAHYVNKSQTQVSTVLSNLLKYKLVYYRQEWRKRIYMPEIDAELAYSDINF